MAYTPELTDRYSGILRRIAWAYGIPMTKAIESIVEYSTKFINIEKVCGACRDESFCEQCPFNQHNVAP